MPAANYFGMGKGTQPPAMAALRQARREKGHGAGASHPYHGISDYSVNCETCGIEAAQPTEPSRCRSRKFISLPLK